MSTKTSIKRIALVAVSALGFGLLSVVPAKAVAGNYTATGTTTNTTNTGAASAPIPSGTAWTGNLTLTTNGASANLETVGITYTVTAGPASLDITSTCTFTSTNANMGANNAITNTGNVFVLSATGANAGGLTGAVIGTWSCPTTIGGTYTLTPTEAAVPTKVGFATGTLTAVTANVSGLNVSQGTTRSTTAGTAQIGGQATVLFTAPTRAAATQQFVVTSTGVGSIASMASSANATIARVNGSTADYSAGGTVVSTANDTTTLTVASVTVTSAAAGVQTINTYSIDATTGVQTLFRTATITWQAATAIGSSSTALMAGPAEATPANFTVVSNAIPRSASRTAGTAIATIYVQVRSAAGAADARANTVRATVTSGVGFVDVNGTDTSLANTSQRIDSNAEADDTRFVRIYSDGIAGTGTVTVSLIDVDSSASITLGTFNYESTGAVTSIAVTTTNFTIGRAGGFPMGTATASRVYANEIGVSATATTTNGTSTTPAFVVTTKDSGGRNANIASNGVPSVVSSDANVVTGGSCARDTGKDGKATLDAAVASSSNGIGVYNCSFTTASSAKSGDKATLTVRTPDPASTTGGFLTTTYAVTIGGGASTGKETITFNKATYEPGEGMTVTLTAVDASGNPVFDGESAPAVSFTKAVTGSMPAYIYIGGKEVSDDSLGRKTLFAPAASGAFQATATSSASTALSATATVGDDSATKAANAASDAAAEAIDAANAATDAANLAAEAADAATVAAEEARDAADAATAAVEKLASDVATLMASLKAQITTLANTVAKIAKKVKA